MKPLNVMTAAASSGSTSILVEPSSPESGNSWKYVLAASASGLTVPAYGQAYSGGTALTASGAAVSVNNETVVGVVELDGSGKAVAWGTAEVNVG